MDYKVGVESILNFLDKGCIDFVSKKQPKEKNDEFHGYLNDIFIKAQSQYAEHKFEEAFKSMISLSQSLAYKIESRKNPSLDIDDLCAFIISIFTEGNSTLAAAAMNLASNCFFFYGEKALISFLKLDFLSHMHNILDNDCNIDLFIESISTLSNMLSVTKCSINIKIKEMHEKNLESDIENDTEVIQDLLSLVDFDTLTEAIPFFPIEKLLNITNLLFRYVSFQEEEELRQRFADILNICKIIFFTIKDIEKKDKDQRDKTKDELISSILNVLSYSLIREKDLYVTIIDTNIVSESFAFMFPEYEQICVSAMFFLINVWNEIPHYFSTELFHEISLEQILLICEVLIDLRSISYLVLAAHIDTAPEESSDEIIYPFLKTAMQETIEGNHIEKSSSFELISTVFIHTDDKTREFLIENGFFECIEECIAIQSPMVIKIIESILFYSNRLDLELPDDLFFAIKEKTEELMDSPIKAISDQAHVIYGLFEE